MTQFYIQMFWESLESKKKGKFLVHCWTNWTNLWSTA